MNIKILEKLKVENSVEGHTLGHRVHKATYISFLNADSLLLTGDCPKAFWWGFLPVAPRDPRISLQKVAHKSSDEQLHVDFRDFQYLKNDTEVFNQGSVFDMRCSNSKISNKNNQA